MLQDLSPLSTLSHFFSFLDLETLPANAVDGLEQLSEIQSVITILGARHHSTRHSFLQLGSSSNHSTTAVSGTYLVVNICDIHYKINLELEIVPQYSPQYIGTNVVSCMAKMCIVIYSWTTSIPSNPSVLPIKRNKGVLSSCE